MYAALIRHLCIQMLIQVKTQKEEADQRFGRLPPIYTVDPLTPITEVSSELSTPVNSSISYYEMDLPADSDYELVFYFHVHVDELTRIMTLVDAIRFIYCLQSGFVCRILRSLPY